MDSETQAILRARTARLARASTSGGPAPSTITLVPARADQTSFAVDASWVVAAVAVRHVAPLPGLPATVAGLLNFRGTPLAVFHPGVVLNQSRQAPAERTHALVLGAQQPEVALLMDDIEPPRDVHCEDVYAPPSELPRRALEFLRGVTRRGELILAVDALLASDRLFCSTFLRRRK